MDVELFKTSDGEHNVVLLRENQGSKYRCFELQLKYLSLHFLDTLNGIQTPVFGVQAGASVENYMVVRRGFNSQPPRICNALRMTLNFAGNVPESSPSKSMYIGS